MLWDERVLGDVKIRDALLLAADELGASTVVNLSGRGDKDLETVLEETDKRELEVAPDLDVFQ